MAPAPLTRVDQLEKCSTVDVFFPRQYLVGLYCLQSMVIRQSIRSMTTVTKVEEVKQAPSKQTNGKANRYKPKPEVRSISVILGNSSQGSQSLLDQSTKNSRSRTEPCLPCAAFNHVVQFSIQFDRLLVLKEQEQVWRVYGGKLWLLFRVLTVRRVLMLSDCCSKPVPRQRTVNSQRDIDCVLQINFNTRGPVAGADDKRCGET